MILPTKHIPAKRSLLGVGAIIIVNLSDAQSVSRLWEKVRKDPSVGSFQRFIMALDLLYAVGILDYSNGEIRRLA